MTRIFSLQGILTLSHLGLVLLAILYAQSFAGPDGTTRVDLVPAYLLWIRNIAIFAVSFPFGWIFLLPTHLHGPTRFDIVFSAVGLGLNSILVGYVVSRIVRKRQVRKE